MSCLFPVTDRVKTTESIYQQMKRLFFNGREVWHIFLGTWPTSQLSWSSNRCLILTGYSTGFGARDKETRDVINQTSSFKLFWWVYRATMENDNSSRSQCGVNVNVFCSETLQRLYFSQEAQLTVPICLFQSQVKERGGDCVPVICDSTNDQEIKDLFEQIKREQNGRLDILVNNAYAGVHVSYTQLSLRGTLLCLLWQFFF